MTRDQFAKDVQTQGYTPVQAQRIAGLVFAETPADKRRRGLAKARAVSSAKAKERREASRLALAEMQS